MNADLTEIRTKVRALLKRLPYLTPEDAEDIEQDTMLAIYTALKKGILTPLLLEEILKYGYKTARQRAADAVRSKIRNRFRAAVTGVLGPQAEGERSGEERICTDIFGQEPGLIADEVERREMCAFLLSRMSADERTLITLYYKGDSYAEIASTLKIPRDRVRDRLHELRQKSRRWKEEWDSGQKCATTRRK